LLQIGVALFLFTSFEGFVIPYFAVPRLGLSAHLLSALLRVLAPALGLLWPRLSLVTAVSLIASWFLIYSAFAIVAAYLMAGIWGAGNTSGPQLHGDVLFVSKSEVASALIYWNGKRYFWLQQGD
jgi:hydroxylaminobenzene mutase